MFDALRQRDFRYLWLSNLAANFAMQMQVVARGWLVYDLTKSPMALSWVMLSFMLPTFVFSLAGGVIADRMRKKSIMMVAQSLNALATAVMATIVVTGHIQFFHFILFGLFNGTVLSFSMPARSSVVPDLVDRESLVNAMALSSATFNLSRVLGPSVAGALIALTTGGEAASIRGAGLVFYLIAGLYALSVWCVAVLDYEGRPQQRREVPPLEDIREGFRYMRTEPLIVGLLLLSFVPMTFGFAPSFLLPAFNKDVLGGGADNLGLLMTSMGAGALAGSLWLARAGDLRRKGRIMLGIAYAWVLVILAFALIDSSPWAMVMGALSGLCGSVFGSINMSIVQMAIRPEIRGRVMSIMMMSQGLMPLGIIPISAAAEFVGIGPALAASGLALAASVYVLDRSYPGLRRIDRG